MSHPLRLLGAHKILQLRFALSDSRFGLRDLSLQFVQTIFHLLALDGIHALCFWLGCFGDRRLVTVRRRGSKTRSLRRLRLELSRSALLAPEIILVVSRIDFHFAVADFEHARGQLVDEVAIV